MISANDQGISAQASDKAEVFSLKCTQATTILPTYYARTETMLPEDNTKSRI